MNEKLIQEMARDIIPYRHDLHRHPQTAYEETYASAMIQDLLTQWGIRFESGLAGTGIVATITGKSTDSTKTIGLRADMDALDIEELTGLKYASTIPGKMHACGHDGHMATLLATARYLKETQSFNGTVHLIFQPAEEGRNGAGAMIKDGLFERFPCDEIFAIHNWPYISLGQAAVCAGPMMAAADNFTVKVTGTGGHAGTTPVNENAVYAAAAMQVELVNVNKDLAGLNLPSVIQTTNFNGGSGAYAIVPEVVKFFGTARTFDQDVRESVKERMQDLSQRIMREYKVDVDLEYNFGVDVTVNDKDSAQFATEIGRNLFGHTNFNDQVYPSSAAEDFGAMLRLVKGAYVWIGQGIKQPGNENKKLANNEPLHSAYYDFNDDFIPYGMKFLISLVEGRLNK